MEKEIIKRWRRKAQTGAHSFYWRGRKYRVKPGDIVEVPEHVLGSFVEKYDLVKSPSVKSSNSSNKQKSEQPKEESTQETQEDSKQLKVVDAGAGYYNIINPDNPDKPLNDDPLTMEEAEKIIQEGETSQ